MADLNALILFAKIVEAKSFTEAARRLKLPVSTISRRVADFENQLGVRLLDRTTRNLRPTAIGAEMLETARRGAELSDAVDGLVSDQRADVSGTLRLSAPPSISDTLLAPIVGAFQAAHPRVRVQILVTDRLLDHVAEGVDLVFRLGAMKDSALVARKILRYRHRLLATPAYLARSGRPERPQDLLAHRLLAFSHWRPTNSWTFVRCDGTAREPLTFEPYLSMNDFAGLAHGLLAEVGIGDLPPLVRPDLVRDGRLVEAMPDWRFRTMDLSLVHLGNRHVPRPVRLFIDFAADMAPRLFPDLPT